jgi:hypothetical protein
VLSPDHAQVRPGRVTALRPLLQRNTSVWVVACDAVLQCWLDHL